MGSIHFIIYETTNTVNRKKYRGAHVCHSLNDGYLGSGMLFKRALAKYGPGAFKRTILLECSSLDEMFEAEARFVDAAWVADPKTYNLKVGGEGGWDYINRVGLRWTDEKRRLHSIEMKKKRANDEFGPKNPPRGMLGLHHSASTKIRLSENNAQKLDVDELTTRRSDLIRVNYPRRGSIAKLSKLWNVSHTQVRRFIEIHFRNVG